jgi:tRNA A37 threonylcarbamoyladenosine synthetase subunit TsaC/SUA5/YrdC
MGGSEEYIHSTRVDSMNKTTKTTAANIDTTDLLSSTSTEGAHQINEKSSESTIIDLTNEQNPRIVRQGAVPKDKIIEALKIVS